MWRPRVPEQLTVTSPDGTVIGAFVEGAGPALVLVHGSTADHNRWAPLVPLLKDEFRLVMIDRRGRGASSTESGDYAIEREGADVLAVLAALPQPAMVFGHSYGATCALGVLDQLPASSPVLLYEPAFATPGNPAFTADQLERWSAVLAAGRREELLELFYREALLFDDAAIENVRALPMWPHRVAAVHTVVREAQCVREFVPAASSPPMPVRFLVGDATSPMLAAATRAAAAATSGSELHVLTGQGHVAIDTAPALVAEHVRATWARRVAS
jgi:pimeloyl-ACP methyl ester carboxylesterase